MGGLSLRGEEVRLEPSLEILITVDRRAEPFCMTLNCLRLHYRVIQLIFRPDLWSQIAL